MFSPFRSSRAVAAILFLSLPPAFSAPLAWDDLPERVRTHSPELVSARLEAEEIRARARTTGWKPASSLQFEARPGLASGGQGSIQAGVERPLARPERLRLEQAAVLAEIPVLEARLREREIALLAEARAAAVVVLQTAARLEVIDRQHAVATELSTFLAARVAAGEASPLESGQAGLEAAQAAVKRAQVQARRTEAEHRLRELLAWPVGESLDLVGALGEPVPEPESPVTVPPSPDAQAAQAEAARAETEGALARISAQPEPSLGFFAEWERSEDAPEGVGNEAFLGVAYSVPLSMPGRAEAEAQATALRAQRWRAEAGRLEGQAALRAAAARAEMDAQARLFQTAGGEPIRLALAQEARAETLLRGGQGDLAAVLRARTQRLALEDVRLDALEAYHLARVRLAAVLQR